MGESGSSKIIQPPHEFYLVSEDRISNKTNKHNGKRRLNVTEISTATIKVICRDGNHQLESFISRVPIFLWDCSNTLYKRSELNNEIFRKSGSNKRVKDFLDKNKEVYIRGCNAELFDRYGLNDLDIATLFKTFLRDVLEPIFYSGEQILNEIDDFLLKQRAIEFDVDANPEFGTFLFVVKFLHALCLKDPNNRLTPENLGIVFAPSFIQDQKRKPDNSQEAQQQAQKAIKIVQKLIENDRYLIAKEAHMKRVRSTSISNERPGKTQGMRRSSSVIGKIMRYMNKERIRIISSVDRMALYQRPSKIMDYEKLGERCCDGRQSRSKNRKSSSITKKDVCESVSKGIERRQSLKENSSLKFEDASGVFRHSFLGERVASFEERELVKLQQLADSSLTALPPSDETIYKVRPSSSSQDLNDVDNTTSCDIDVDLIQFSFSPKGPCPSLSGCFHKSVEDSPPGIAEIFTVPKFEDTDFQQCNIRPRWSVSDELIRKPAPPPVPPRNPSTKLTENIKCKLETRQSDKDEVVEDVLFPKSAIQYYCLEPTPCDEFKTPSSGAHLQVRMRKRRDSFERENFSNDMASVITSSGMPEELGSRVNFAQTHRPSLALLKESKQVTNALAKFEKQTSIGEIHSPRRVLQTMNSPNPSQSTGRSTL